MEQADSRLVEREMSGFQYDFGMAGTIPDDNLFIHHPVYEDEPVLVAPADTMENVDTVRESLAIILHMRYKTPYKLDFRKRPSKRPIRQSLRH